MRADRLDLQMGKRSGPQGTFECSCDPGDLERAGPGLKIESFV